MASHYTTAVESEYDRKLKCEAYFQSQDLDRAAKLEVRFYTRASYKTFRIKISDIDLP